MRYGTGSQCNDNEREKSRDQVTTLAKKFVHTLKFQDVLKSNIMIKGIAIIKSTANKSSCNSFGDSKRLIPVNTTKVTNMIKAAITSV